MSRSTRSPATSRYWRRGDLLVDGHIGRSPLRLAITHGDKDLLYATDSDGQEGRFLLTEKMADGEFRWMIQAVSEDEVDDDGDAELYEVGQRVILTKRSLAGLLSNLEKWEREGIFSIDAALKASLQ